MSAGSRRAELEKKEIQFSKNSGSNTITGELCQVKAPQEVFAAISCHPDRIMNQGDFYTDSAGSRSDRGERLKSTWHTLVPRNTCVAGVDFDQPSTYLNATKNFTPAPPVTKVRISLVPANVATGNGDDDD
ncbi:MAG: hypothetical protein KDA84_25720 [Planctomycetaceae bacterium]|nr:hypothetical protein [Planctomycetaceae bacterium]